MGYFINRQTVFLWQPPFAKEGESDPDVSGKDACVEIVRIIFLQDSTSILVMVGLWLKEGEEDVWGNLLYDLISLVAMSIDKSNPDELRAILATKVLEYIDKPNTKYEGHYY